MLVDLGCPQNEPQSVAQVHYMRAFEKSSIVAEAVRQPNPFKSKIENKKIQIHQNLSPTKLLCSIISPSSLSLSSPSPHPSLCTHLHKTSLSTLSLALSCIFACILPSLTPTPSSLLFSPFTNQQNFSLALHEPTFLPAISKTPLTFLALSC